MSGHGPLVTFVVPCYKLGHLVGECLASILRQSYRNLEVVVMDDCSPDDTTNVVAAIEDPRLRYVRNEQNLGHLRNYNRGIDLAKGKYVWLISADDVLRSDQVVDRFVKVLERHPNVGFVFCPAVRFRANGDLGIYGSHGARDQVFDGRRFLRQWLVRGNSVPAASGLVRKSSYERTGGFPLDMPFAGDWYMWSIFALHFDVAYLGAPMVGYRAHDANMTLDFKGRPAALVADMFKVLWAMKSAAEREGFRSLGRLYLRSIAVEYAYKATRPNSSTGAYLLSIPEIHNSLSTHCQVPSEQAYIWSVVHAVIGDHEYDSGNSASADEQYRKALRYDWRSLRTRSKRVLIHLGPIGHWIRAALAVRRPAELGLFSLPRQV